MSTVYQILSLAMIGLLVFFLYRSVKGRPDMFTMEKFSKTLTTLGILALVLIGFVAFLVMVVRN